MSESNESGCCYPLRSSCSFLTIDYYEEASSKFEEYLTDALIPERCCLLNDVCYPLERIDSFYWAPWVKAEYDEEFLSREADKVGEKLLKICSNVPSIFETENIIIDDDIFPKCNNLFDLSNFKEQNLYESRNKLINSVDNYFFLEVPHIPLCLKIPRYPLKLLINNTPLMDLEDIFEREINLPFEDLEASFECSPETNAKQNFLLEYEEKFKEMILPKISDEDVNDEHLSLNCEKNNALIKAQNDWQTNINDSEESFEDEDINAEDIPMYSEEKLLFPEFPKSDSFSDKSTPSKNVNLATLYEKQDTANGVFHASSKFKILPYRSSSFNSLSHPQTFGKNINVAFNNFFLSEKNVPSKFKTNNKNTGNLSDIYEKDFIENFFNIKEEDGEDIANQSVYSNNVVLDLDELNSDIVCHSNANSNNSETHLSGNSQVFLNKLSSIDLMKPDEMPNSNASTSKAHQIDSNYSVKGFTAFRNKTLESPKPSVENLYSKTESYLDNSYKSQNFKYFNLLSSFLHTKKKECQEIGCITSPSCSQKNENSLEKDERSKNDFVDVTDRNIQSSFENVLINSNENNTLPVQNVLINSNENNTLPVQNEDIIVRFPDDYVELILSYEDATTYYIQKLLPWEGFQFSSDLTIISISLDKTRFILNQEAKSCRDRNMSPLEGGIHFSHYIQLLTLHGILKSLYCFIHFGAQLSLSTLSDFEKKYKSALKGFSDDLISKVTNFIEKQSTINAVHPKVKAVCSYLQEKYYFYKDNGIPFKVLIILKEHLSSFHSSFEAFMKTLLPEIAIDLIPESCYLEPEADVFSINDEHIYTICVSSFSKNMLGKTFTLVLEYETDNSTCWRTFCKQENVTHASVKLYPLPLKTLIEIKSLPLQKDSFNCTSKELHKMLVVISTSISSKYNVRSSLHEKQNISVYERSYYKYLPHMHFADITINHTVCVLVVNMMSFIDGDFLNNLIDRVFNLHLKYEICWIIIHDNSSNRYLNEECLVKIQKGCHKFYSMAINIQLLQSFKIKFLYAKCEEEVLKFIIQILSKNLKIALNKFDCYPKIDLPAEMNEVELYFVSFPSLNPVVVAYMLSSKLSISELMNLDYEVLHNKFYFISERFLKHFYKLIHESINLNHKPFDEIKRNFGSMKSSVPKSSYSNNEIVKKSNSSSNEINKFINCIQNYQNNEDNFNVDFDARLSPSDSYSLECNKFFPDNYAEMSVEEIDRNYRELLLEDMAAASFDIDFGNNSPMMSVVPSAFNSKFSTDNISSHLDVPPSKKRKFDSLQIHSINTDLKEKSMLKNVSCCLSEYSQSSKYLTQPTHSSTIKNETCAMKIFDNVKTKLNDSLYRDDKNLKSPKSTLEKLNFSQYKYSDKRKLDYDNTDQYKSVKFCSQNSVLCTSSRIQKGQSSKTVCKDTWFENIPKVKPVGTSHIFRSSSFSQNYASESQSICNKKRDCSKKSDSQSLEKLDSSWMSQGNMLLTPRQSHRLSYEKIPGSKGQTRLVFR